MIFTNWISLKMLVDHFLIIARGYFLTDWEKELNVDNIWIFKKSFNIFYDSYSMLDYGMSQPLPHSNHKQCNFPYKIDGLMGGHVPPPRS